MNAELCLIVETRSPRLSPWKIPCSASADSRRSRWRLSLHAIILAETLDHVVRTTQQASTFLPSGSLGIEQAVETIRKGDFVTFYWPAACILRVPSTSMIGLH
jgi:hypothetical protein